MQVANLVIISILSKKNCECLSLVIYYFRNKVTPLQNPQLPVSSFNVLCSNLLLMCSVPKGGFIFFYTEMNYCLGRKWMP